MVLEYPDGKLAFKYGYRTLYQVFDKLAIVDLGVIVDNKRLGAVLKLAQIQQYERNRDGKRERNHAVDNQRLSRSNARWKWTKEYNHRFIAETAMYRVKQLFGGSLTLRDYNCQVAEALAMALALNKITRAGMPVSVRIA